MPALNAPSFRRRLPPMPAFSTLILIGADGEIRRLARTSGHRLFVSGVEALPSVIESPSVTIAPAASGASTSSRDSRNQLRVVETVGSFDAPAWLPVSEI